MTKKGLILEGGAMRGLFSAGVIDVMMQNGIHYDGIIGVSAGAAFGCNYKSNQIGRVIRYNRRFAKDKRFSGIYSLVTTGDLYGADFCYREIPDILDPIDRETYVNNPVRFYVVCTDADTGETIYPCLETMDEHDTKYLQASASMPVVSRAVEIDGHRYLDGGISDSIPIRQFEKMGYDRNVLVLTRPLSYRKKPLGQPKLMEKLLKEYPKIYETLQKRSEVYNETLDYIREKEEKGEIFVIRPEEPLKVGKLEKNIGKIQEAYDTGVRTGKKIIPDLLAFLNQ